MKLQRKSVVLGADAMGANPGCQGGMTWVGVLAAEAAAEGPGITSPEIAKLSARMVVSPVGF